MDYSKLTSSDKPTSYEYNHIELENSGYKLKWQLDKENPAYLEAIEECKNNNWEYKVMPRGKRQSDIWIKNL